MSHLGRLPLHKGVDKMRPDHVGTFFTTVTTSLSYQNEDYSILSVAG